jgi:TPR repeat protein
MYLGGNGIAKDNVKARQLAQEAANGSDALGFGILGAMMRDGLGGPQDAAKGLELLEAAKEKDPSLSYPHYQLGISFEFGRGTEVNKDRAVEEYRKALQAGAVAAKERLKELGHSE